jgi:imidazolonepropionase-like amidohydrolase
MIGLFCASALAGPPLLIEADRVHTVSGGVLEKGAVLVEGGRITAVGRQGEVSAPAGAIKRSGAVLTPGLIDAWTTAGLSGPMNHAPDQDHAEARAPVQPELRALDGYHPDPLVAWIRGFGVTTVQAGPSPGQPVSGRTLVTRTTPRPVDEVALIADGAVVFSLGSSTKDRFGGDGAQSRMGGAALVRQALSDAREYAERRALKGADRAPVDLGKDALVDVLEKRRKAVFHAHRADDLLTAVRIADEFGLDIVLAGAAEGWLVADELAEAGAPVLVGPVMARSWRAGDQRNSNFENAALLADAGVKVAFMSGYEGYVPKVRVVLWEAAVAGANGLGPERTLRALTLDAADILGIAARTGSIEVGKDADLVLYDGDPFEYA